MDISGLNLEPFKKYTDIKIDLSKISASWRNRYQNVRSKFQRPLLIPVFKIIIVLMILSVVLPYLYKNTYVRWPLSGTVVGSYIFCLGKPLCADSRCVGETYRECRACPTGTSRSVAKVSCEENLYSDCRFDDNKCVDRTIIDRIF